MSYPLSDHLADRLPAEVIDALDRGQSVIPMGQDKSPLVRWKLLQDQQPTSDELSRWLNDFGPRIRGWARITGSLSGVIVLDDDKAGWFERWGVPPHVRTGSGGHHWIGRHPGWRVKTVNSITCKRLGETFPRLDIRGDGGYSLICGFNARGGYTWLRAPEPDPLDVLPMEARQFFGLLNPPEPPRPAARPARRLIYRDSDRPLVDYLIERATEEARVAGRNNGGFWLAQQLRDNGYSQAEAETAGGDYMSRLWHTDTKGHVDAYAPEEYLRTVESVYSEPPREPWERREWRAARTISGDALPPLRRPQGLELPPPVRPAGIQLPPPAPPRAEELREAR